MWAQKRRFCRDPYFSASHLPGKKIMAVDVDGVPALKAAARGVETHARSERGSGAHAHFLRKAVAVVPHLSDEQKATMIHINQQAGLAEHDPVRLSEAR